VGCPREELGHYRYLGLTLAKAVVAWPGAGARGADPQAGRRSSLKPLTYPVPMATPEILPVSAAGAKRASVRLADRE
jgi:hypothetical protein